MIDYRLVKHHDWPEIKALVNQVFQEKIPMDVSFPLLFTPSNTFSYVAVENQQIIGFIGVQPEELSTPHQTFYGSRIGAVCIGEAYQGQGIGRCLFRVMKAAATYDFILISGQGKLYLQEGGELFGDFAEFVVPSKNSGLAITKYQGELPLLLKIHHLLQKRACFFKQSPAHLQQLIEAQALANLWAGKQGIYLSQTDEGKAGCLITCSRQEGNVTVTEVLEQAGDAQVISQMVQQLALELPNVTIRPSFDSELTVELEKISSKVSVKNAGTVLYLNEKIKEVSIPHTWDLAFL